MLMTMTTTTILLCVVIAIGMGSLVYVKKFTRGLALNTLVTLAFATGVTVISIYITTSGKHVWVIAEDPGGVIAAKEYRLYLSTDYRFTNGTDAPLSISGDNADHTLVINDSTRTVRIKELPAIKGAVVESDEDDVWVSFNEAGPMSVLKSGVHIMYVADDRHAPPKKFKSDNRQKNRYLLTWE